MQDDSHGRQWCSNQNVCDMRHMARTHQIDVDALFERIHGEQGMCIKHINKKLQSADIFNKGSFSVQTWNTLCRLLQVGPLVQNSN